MPSKRIKRKPSYSARMFNRATVVCPSCLKRTKRAEEKCSYCDFDAYRTVQQFPQTPLVLERFIDSAGVTDAKLIEDVGAAVDKLIEKFPQLGMYFCFVEMDEQVNLPEFGFWMMNAWQLQKGQKEKDRAWSILLLMDVNRGLLSLTPGYAIEAFIDDDAWEDALRKMVRNLEAGDYRSALLVFVKNAGRLLRESARDVSNKLRQQK